MFEAQEMFQTANRLSRPEKALILGFMAGSRENPHPEQGDVVRVSKMLSWSIAIGSHLILCPRLCDVHLLSTLLLFNQV